MSEHLLIYEFIHNPVANALIVVKPATESLVFVAMADTKPRLLADAKRFAAKTKHTLKNASLLKKHQMQWFQQMQTDFEAILSGDSSSPDKIKCEYLLGTQFQKDVWEATRSIKPGTTITYSQLAVQMGKKNASRAVGSALGKNNVAIVVPCHRIVGTKGQLTGFRWGLKLKQSLLEQERTMNSSTNVL